MRAVAARVSNTSASIYTYSASPAEQSPKSGRLLLAKDPPTPHNNPMPLHEIGECAPIDTELIGEACLGHALIPARDLLARAFHVRDKALPVRVTEGSLWPAAPLDVPQQGQPFEAALGLTRVADVFQPAQIDTLAVLGVPACFNIHWRIFAPHAPEPELNHHPSAPARSRKIPVRPGTGAWRQRNTHAEHINEVVLPGVSIPHPGLGNGLPSGIGGHAKLGHQGATSVVRGELGHVRWIAISDLRLDAGEAEGSKVGIVQWPPQCSQVPAGVDMLVAPPLQAYMRHLGRLLLAGPRQGTSVLLVPVGEGLPSEQHIIGAPTAATGEQYAQVGVGDDARKGNGDRRRLSLRE
jgi:hypothetical protein